MEQFGKKFSARRSQATMHDKHNEIYRAGTPQDVTDVRAKSERHKKVSADKWNQ
jgi:hypothetical protein